MKQTAKILLFFVFACICMFTSIKSEATVYYSYTQSGGNRNAQLLTSWKSNTNGTGVSPASFNGADEFRVQAGDSLYTNSAFNLPAGKLVLVGTNSKFYAKSNNALTLDMGAGALYLVEGPYTNLTLGSISPTSTLSLFMTTTSTIDFTKTYAGNLEIRSKYLYTFNIGNNLTVGGNLIIGTINPTRLDAGLSGNITLNVGKDLIIGNNTTFAPCLPNATNSPVLNIGGNVMLRSGSIFYSSRGSGNPTYAIGGDLNAANGSIFYGPSSSAATINVVYSIGKNLIINGTYNPKPGTSPSTITFSFPSNALSSSITYATASTVYTHALTLSKAVSLASNFKTETLTLNSGSSLSIGANTLTIDKPINYSGGVLAGGAGSNLVFSNLNTSALTLNTITLQSLNVSRKNVVTTLTLGGTVQILGSINTSYVNVVHANLIALSNNATLIRNFYSTYDLTPSIAGVYNLNYPTTTPVTTGPEASASATALFNLTTAGPLTLNKALTINGTLTTLSTSGDIAQNGYTLTIKGNIANNGSLGTGLTSRGSLLRFSGTTALSGSGTYNLPTILISTGASLTSSAGNINILGNASVESSTFTFNPNGGSVTYNHPSFDQTIAPLNYYNLLLSGAAGKKIFSSTAVTKIANLFSIGNAVLTTANSSIEFNGAADQLLPVIAYYNLAVSNSGNKIVSGTTTVSNNLSIAGSAILLAAGNTLNVGGNWNSYSNAGFSEGTSTVIFNGSGAQNISVTSGNEIFYNLTINKNGGIATLASPGSVSNILTLTKGTLASGGNLTVNLNTASIDGSGTGTVTGDITIIKSVSAPNDRTHYIAVPLTGTTPKTALMDDVEVISSYSHLSRLNRFDIPTKSFKVVSDTNMLLTPLTSYSLFFPIGSTTLDYTGGYNHTASYTLPLANAAAGSYHIGNPFPSTIDWNAASGWTKTNLNNAIALWNANTNKYDTYINGVATGSASQYIAPFQGFVVSASAAGATVGMTNAVRSNTIKSVLRTADANELIRVKVSSGSDFDETIIGFDEDATALYDGSYDAPKYLNHESVPSLYSTDSSGTKLAVNTYSSSFTSLYIPLSIENGIAGNQVLTFDGFEDLADYIITLKDFAKGKSVVVRPGDGYTFNTYEASATSRFALIIGQANTNTGTDVNIYSFEKTVYINTPPTVTLSSIDIFDSFGKHVKSLPASNTAHYEISVNDLTSGIYIVKTNSNTGITTEKVIIK